MSQASFKKRLKVLMNRTENQVCSDCPERQPRWASLIVPPPGSEPGSLPIGAFCCLECSGSHRRLGVHISFVRSVTLDSWKEKEVLAMENGGNQKVNSIFEANITVAKPSTGASGSVRERFIRDKYERRKYYNPAALQQYQQSSDDSSSDESEDEAPPQRNVVRAPSEAARLRAQARKQRSGMLATASATSKSASSPSKTKSRAVQKRLAPTAPAPTPAPISVDLLDFGFPPVSSNPGPPPNPPSASPSPTIDMFKNMNVGGDSAPSVNTQNEPAPPQQQNKMSSDDILSLFNTPSQNNSNMGFNMGMNNGMNNMNQMGAMNMNPNSMMTMNNQQMQNNGMMMNNNNNINTGNNNNSSPMLQMPQSNVSFFNGMQNTNNNNMNMNNNMNSNMINNNGGMNNNMNNGGQTQMNMNHSSSSGMSMQQNQQQDFGMNSMAPMGGAPSNLTVMGSGNGMNQQAMYGGANEQKNNGSSFDFMGGSPTPVTGTGPGAGNPQMNQFASFGSFR